MARARNRHQAAGRLVDAECGLGRGLADAIGEFAEIPLHHRLQIGVEHRGGEPLVFAEFRLHLGRDREIHVRIGGAKRIADHRLVRGIEKREKKAHRAGVRLRRADLLHQRVERTGLERAYRAAVGRDALGRLEAKLARHQRGRIVRLQVEHLGTNLPPDLDQVAETFGDHQRDLAAAALDQRVRRNRGAVREPRDRAEIDAVPGQLAQARDDGLRRIGGRGGDLVQDDAVVCVVERKEVREGAADIDTDHPGHCTTPLRRSCRAHRGRSIDAGLSRASCLRDNAARRQHMAWVGQSIERVEDAALLTGRGRYIDDIPVSPGTLHAAVLRSPHPHAVIRAIDASAARAGKGIAAVITAEDVTRFGAPLLAGVKANIECWPCAVGTVRYVGEPVAVVVAADRYLAEDALELIEVEYRPLPITLRPADALKPDSAVLHEGLGGNIASDRSFRYGDPEGAFASAAHRVTVKVDYPRNSCTPIETYGLVADYDPGEDAYDVLATFQGPFSIHAVLARALKVPGNRLRLRTPPDSGGSFGVKQGIFPYIALMAIASRVAGRPVKWIEDRLEHLVASVSATNRLITLEAAVEPDGRVMALVWDQVEDVGAHIRAPEPATLYRMHGNLTGAYDIRNVSVRNRVVLTNKTPTGLNRGFGGPQVYYALERLMQRIAVELSLDPLDVVRRNLVPSGAFPFHTATGGLLDSGDYPAAVQKAIDEGGLAELRARQKQARAEGRLYGIGLTAVVEPSVSNMGYITTVLTSEERRKAGPRTARRQPPRAGSTPAEAGRGQLRRVRRGRGAPPGGRRAGAAR